VADPAIPITNEIIGELALIENGVKWALFSL